MQHGFGWSGAVLKTDAHARMCDMIPMIPAPLPEIVVADSSGSSVSGSFSFEYSFTCVHFSSGD